ncbi:MAG: rhodoquinone biosynthesis methyltransferase RquA [Candidatus Dactylopiibacterium sp.]|nr:rhodoquinone biosynthesis methyltransferase RquA [Candidatus Dactylopiibacterium sp.]
MSDTSCETLDLKRPSPAADARRPAPPAAVVPPEVPAYMHEVYDWAYVNPAWVRWLDHNIVVKTLLFGNDRRLMRRYLERLRPGMRVWQVAHVYGDLVRLAAQRVGPDGAFDLTDITPIQIAHGKRKIGALPWTRVIRQDAGIHRGDASKPYDLVCSFFLLHEVPDDWKRRIVDNMLEQVPASGEAIFVDYHAPARWQPVRYILKWVNRLLEPFAEALWEHEIAHFASRADEFEWHKETIFGGVYQIVRARRRQP